MGTAARTGPARTDPADTDLAGTAPAGTALIAVVDTAVPAADPDMAALAEGRAVAAHPGRAGSAGADRDPAGPGSAAAGTAVGVATGGCRQVGTPRPMGASSEGAARVADSGAAAGRRQPNVDRRPVTGPIPRDRTGVRGSRKLQGRRGRAGGVVHHSGNPGWVKYQNAEENQTIVIIAASDPPRTGSVQPGRPLSRSESIFAANTP